MLVLVSGIDDLPCFRRGQHDLRPHKLTSNSAIDGVWPPQSLQRQVRRLLPGDQHRPKCRPLPPNQADHTKIKPFTSNESFFMSSICLTRNSNHLLSKNWDRSLAPLQNFCSFFFKKERSDLPNQADESFLWAHLVSQSNSNKKESNLLAKI